MYKRIVVKVGTSTLAHPTGMLNIRSVEKLVKVLSDIKNSGMEIILVTSGSIGVGAGKLHLKSKPLDMPSRQACAAIGQCELMYIYDKLFGEYGHIVSQILLTRDIINNANGKQNVLNTFERLLELRAIPIVNENDSVSTDEIEFRENDRFGDNDTLSAIVSVLAGADILVILTDTDGLYNKDPRNNPDAELIPEISEITDDIKALAKGKGSKFGTGGMVTKITAAETAAGANIPTVILNGSKPALLYDLFEGKSVGTIFTI